MWSNLTYYSDICIEKLQNTTKTSRTAGVPVEIRKSYSRNTSSKQHCWSQLCQWAFVIETTKKESRWQCSPVSDQWYDHPNTCQQFSVIEDKKDQSGSEVVKWRENKIVKLDWDSVTHDYFELSVKKSLRLHDRTSESLPCTIRDVI